MKGEELERLNEERATLLEKTEYYDADRLDAIPRLHRFPINYTQNAVLGDEANRESYLGRSAVSVCQLSS